jgi:hypothetical protein
MPFRKRCAGPVRPSGRGRAPVAREPQIEGEAGRKLLDLRSRQGETPAQRNGQRSLARGSKRAHVFRETRAKVLLDLVEQPEIEEPLFVLKQLVNPLRQRAVSEDRSPILCSDRFGLLLRGHAGQ